MSKSFPTPSKTFFILFFLHLFLSLVLRLTGQLEQRIFNEILIYGALAYSMIGSQWNYDPSYLKTSSVLFLLYLLSIYTLQDFSNNGLSASEAIEWGTTLFAFFWLFTFYCGMADFCHPFFMSSNIPLSQSLDSAVSYRW